jgi:hypothetical protein
MWRRSGQRRGPLAAYPASKLNAFRAHLEERLIAGVWNAAALFRELKERSCSGVHAILKDWLHPQREAARVVAVRPFEPRLSYAEDCSRGLIRQTSR